MTTRTIRARDIDATALPEQARAALNVYDPDVVLDADTPWAVRMGEWMSGANPTITAAFADPSDALVYAENNRHAVVVPLVANEALPSLLVLALGIDAPVGPIAARFYTSAADARGKASTWAGPASEFHETGMVVLKVAPRVRLYCAACRTKRTTLDADGTAACCGATRMQTFDLYLTDRQMGVSLAATTFEQAADVVRAVPDLRESTYMAGPEYAEWSTLQPHGLWSAAGELVATFADGYFARRVADLLCERRHGWQVLPATPQRRRAALWSSERVTPSSHVGFGPLGADVLDAMMTLRARDKGAEGRSASSSKGGMSWVAPAGRDRKTAAAAVRVLDPSLSSAAAANIVDHGPPDAHELARTLTAAVRPYATHEPADADAVAALLDRLLDGTTLAPAVLRRASGGTGDWSKVDVAAAPENPTSELVEVETGLPPGCHDALRIAKRIAQLIARGRDAT